MSLLGGSEDLAALSRGAAAGAAAFPLARHARHSLAKLRRVIADIRTTNLSAEVLKAVLELPSSDLERVKDELLALQDHPHPSVRGAIVRGLARGSWATRDEAEQVWRERLKDDVVEIRNDAWDAFRGKELSPFDKIGLH